jgi:hypothetical protein
VGAISSIQLLSPNGTAEKGEQVKLSFDGLKVKATIVVGSQVEDTTLCTTHANHILLRTTTLKNSAGMEVSLVLSADITHFVSSLA